MSIGTRVQARGMYLVALDKLQGAVRWFYDYEVQRLNPAFNHRN